MKYEDGSKNYLEAWIGVEEEEEDLWRFGMSFEGEDNIGNGGGELERRAEKFVEVLALATDTTRLEVQGAMSEALRTGEWLYGEEDAIKWAEGFDFEQELIDKEEEALRASGGPGQFQNYMKLVQEGRRVNRLNLDRIRSYKDDPE
jgi:hypothetical protein